MDFDLAERRRQGKIVTRKKPLSGQVKKVISLLIFTLLFLIVILSIVYLLNTTQSSQKGYTLKQEQLRKDDLQLENRGLVQNIIQAMSFDKIEQSEIVKSMTKVENPLYIEADQQ